DLLVELEQDAGRARREVSLTIVTHASCHIPRATVEALARRAALHAVFVLPSHPLALDYLPLLRQHQVVTAEALAAPAESTRRALVIVGAVASATARHRRPRGSLGAASRLLHWLGPGG